jgi:hypothetical protein
VEKIVDVFEERPIVVDREIIVERPSAEQLNQIVTHIEVQKEK